MKQSQFLLMQILYIITQRDKEKESSKFWLDNADFRIIYAENSFFNKFTALPGLNIFFLEPEAS